MRSRVPTIVLRFWLVCSLGCGLSGCQEEHEVAPAGCRPLGEHFCQELLTPQDSSLRAIWGSSANDIWAGGDGGTLLHYDGATWATVDSGTTEPLVSLWGSARNDVWAVTNDGVHKPDGTAIHTSTILHYDGSSWQAVRQGTVRQDVGLRIAGSGPRDVWVGGSPPLHYDGTAWTPVPELDPKSDCHFWVWDADDIWRACNFVPGSALAHFDGQRWTDSAVPGIATASIFGFWGSASNDIWAATTAENSVLHYDGIQWKLVAFPQYSSTTSLWGSGPADLWGVDYLSPYLMHYDGAAWSAVDYGLKQSLHGVWGTGPQDVWVVGDHGAISHYDGTRWSLKRANPWPDVQIYGMGGSSASDRWIVGGTSLLKQGLLGQYDGQAWVRQQLSGLPDPSQYTTLFAIWERGPDDLFVGSQQNGAPVLLHRGTEWSVISLPKEVTGSIWAIWGSGADELWVATTNSLGAPVATLSHRTGANWSVLSAAPLVVTLSIWGSGPDDIWFGGASNAHQSTGGMLHYDGKQLTYTDLGLAVESISGTGSADIWATAGGTIELSDGHSSYFYTKESLLYYDGQSWSRQAEPALTYRGAKVLTTRPGDVWLVANDLHHRKDGSWTRTPAPLSSLRDIWASDPRHIWFFGGANIVRYLP